jgi:pyruvate ferredoxin oxidoreductase alpha subunit
MREQIEGSQAVARTVAACRPNVVCAYPITPQTHIVEALGSMVRRGTLHDCAFINVESEFAAMSVAIGASATGARAYTATASQGLLFMIEAVYNAAGLGLSVVMTLANRAIGAPINIWNDHSDAMAVRDSGWVQLFAESAQAAVDLHALAFRLAETVDLPVMVCVDGYVLTHAVEEVDLLDQDLVDAYLPPYEPRQSLDPDHPESIGAMVGPEAFSEVRYLAHAKQLRALEAIPVLDAELAALTGRSAGGLLTTYETDGADTIVVAMGSVLGTLQDAIDRHNRTGPRVGAVGLTTFRPFPTAALRSALDGVANVVVLEKAFSIGLGGVLATDVALATGGRSKVSTVVAGLGGRPITTASLERMLDQATSGTLGELQFLDLDLDLVQRELDRMDGRRHSGASAENMLRDRAATGSLAK